MHITAPLLTAMENSSTSCMEHPEWTLQSILIHHLFHMKRNKITSFKFDVWTKWTQKIVNDLHHFGFMLPTLLMSIENFQWFIEAIGPWNGNLSLASCWSFHLGPRRTWMDQKAVLWKGNLQHPMHSLTCPAPSEIHNNNSTLQLGIE